MARFPGTERSESKRQLTTQQPSFLAPEPTQGKDLELFAKVGAAATDAASKFAVAFQSAKDTAADLNTKTSVADITSRAEVDTDINAFNKYSQELDKAYQSNAKGISGEAEQRLKHEIGLEKIKLQGTFRKKQIDSDRANTLGLIDLQVNDPRPDSLLYVKSLLDQKVSLGVYSREDAYKLYQKANDDLGVNKINKDLYQAKTPDDVDAVTEKITSGAYEQGGVTIEPDKKKSLLDIADRARTNTEKKLQSESERLLVQNRIDTISGIASGKLNIEDVNLADISEFDPQLSSTLTKVKDFIQNYNPKLPPEEQGLASAGLMTQSQIMNMRNYAKSITDVFLHDDNKALSDFMLRELSKKGDGLNSSVKLAAFTNLAALKAKVNDQQNPADAQSVERFNSIKSAVRFLENANPYFAHKSISDFMIKNFLSGNSNSEQVMSEAKNVLKDKIIDKYKSISKLNAIPNKIVDGDGTVEDLHSGLNELEGETYSGDYGDQEPRE